MDALTRAICGQLSQCLLCYAAAYADLSNSSSTGPLARIRSRRPVNVGVMHPEKADAERP